MRGRYSRPAPLGESHRLAGFSSGIVSLDSWLGKQARQAVAADTARVYVTTDGSRVVGFYTLAAASVAPGDGTTRLRKGQTAQRPIPVILLARLAVDLEHQGKGLGRSLLQDALMRTAAAAESIGARALTVHAVDDAARGWYARFGFEPSPTDPHHLILLMKDLRKILAS